MEAKHVQGPLGSQDSHDEVTVYQDRHGAWEITIYRVPGSGFAALAINPQRTVRVSTGREPAANPHAALEQIRVEVDRYERILSELAAEIAADEPTRPGGRHFIRRAAGEHQVPAELLEHGGRRS